MTLYVEDELIGELPVVSEGIKDCSETSKGLEKLLKLGISTVTVKNSAGEVVVDLDIELENNGRMVSISAERKGESIVSAWQKGGSNTCLIVELGE